MSECAYYKFFENFSNSTRFQIVCTLLEEEKSVSQIVKDTNIEQSKASHNLKKLAECNIVTIRKEGKKRIYSLNKETILPLLDLVGEHVCTNCRECPR